MKVKAFECKCPKCGATLEIEKKTEVNFSAPTVVLKFF